MVVSPEWEYVAFVDSVNHLTPDIWPANINTDITLSDNDVWQCQHFCMQGKETVQGFREFLDSRGHRLPRG